MLSIRNVQKPVRSVGLGIAALALGYYTLNGSAHLAIAYPAIALNIALLEKYWFRLPKFLRQTLAVSWGVLFAWLAITNAQQADAIFFDRVLELLTTNINVFGAAASGLASAPGYIVAILKIIGIIGFGFVMVMIFKSGNDEDETRRYFGRIFKWMGILLIGAVMIDIFFA